MNYKSLTKSNIYLGIYQYPLCQLHLQLKFQLHLQLKFQLHLQLQ